MTTDRTENRERTWAIFCHLSALSMFLMPPFFVPSIGNIFGPLVVWLVKRNTMALVDEEGKESLNFQISMTIYASISGLLFFLGIGLMLLVVVSLFDILCVIIASVKTSNNEKFRYPCTIRFIR